MGIEFQILDFIQGFRTPFGDTVMPLISSLGNAGCLWIGLTVILLLLPEKRKSGGILLAALLFDLLLCNILIKPLVARVRPCDVNTAVELLIAHPVDMSFPSGHTAASFASVAALYLAGERKLWKISLVLTVLIAFSRLYLYVHYPTDVLGGAVIGILSGYLGFRCAEALRKAKREGKP